VRMIECGEEGKPGLDEFGPVGDEEPAARRDDGAESGERGVVTLRHLED
jgi:hypothetical protein